MCPETDEHCGQAVRTSKESGTTPFHCWSLVFSKSISLNVSLPRMMFRKASSRRRTNRNASAPQLS